MRALQRLPPIQQPSSRRSNRRHLYIAIETIQLMLGDEKLVARDMTLTFGVVALITLSSVFFFARLKPDAGAEVSGKAVAAPQPLSEAAE